MPPTNIPPTDGAAETSSKHKPSTETETFPSRGLPNGADPGKPNGTPRNEAASYYGASPAHPFSSPSYVSANDAAYNALVEGTGGGGGLPGGVSGNYNPQYHPTYMSPGMSHNAPTGVPYVPGTSTYNPTPVPQVSPYHTGVAGTPSATFAGTPSAVFAGVPPADLPGPLPAPPTAPNNSHNPQTLEGESASYYGAPQTGTSITSSAGSTVQTQHVSSGFSHSLESTITGITNAVQGHPHNHNQNHNHNGPPPPLRQSIRKLWENVRAEERYAIGQYEIYSEFIGVCSGCFDPGSSAVQAPRTHHYGQRLTKKGWRTKRKSSRRVWFFRSKNSGISSPSNRSSSSESTASVSDSELSDGTRKRRVLEKRIRRERKELRRTEQQELREREGYTGSSRRQSHSSSSNIKTSTSASRSAAGLLRGGDLDKSRSSGACYDPGYDLAGQAHPAHYTGNLTHEKKQLSKSSGSVLGGWFGSSRRSQKHQRTSSQVSRTSSSNSPPAEPLQFAAKSSSSSSAAANNDALVYGRYSSSLSSVGSNKGWFSKSKKGKGKKVEEEKKKNSNKKKVNKDGKGKGKSSSSSSSTSSGSSSNSSPFLDGLVYGRVYDSRKGTSLDSASIKSKHSYAGSVSESIKSAGSSVFEIGKMQRRKSWDDYGTPGLPGRSGSAAVGPGSSRRSSTGGSKTLAGTSSTSQVTSVAASNSSWWGGKARKSDGYALQAGNGARSTAASTQGGWFPGGGRKSGGWFGGSGAVRTTRSMSMSSVESGVGPGDNVRDQYVFSTGGGAARHSGSEASTTGAKSHSSIDLTSTTRRGKESEIFMQRQNSESRALTSSNAEDKKLKDKEIWIQDPVRRERSPDRSSITTAGSQRRASSADSWESDSRQTRTHVQKSSTQKSVSTATTRTGFLGLFSGRSEGRREENKTSTKESGRKSAKTEELKGSKKEKAEFYTTKEGKIIRKDSTSSATYVAGTPKEEKTTKLQTIYSMVCRSSFAGAY